MLRMENIRRSEYIAFTFSLMIYLLYEKVSSDFTVYVYKTSVVRFRKPNIVIFTTFLYVRSHL